MRTPEAIWAETPHDLHCPERTSCGYCRCYGRRALAAMRAMKAEALEEAAKAERAAVVVWHRGEAAKLRAEQEQHVAWTSAWMSIREQSETHEEAADAIEQGQHLPGAAAKEE